MALQQYGGPHCRPHDSEGHFDGHVGGLMPVVWGVYLHYLHARQQARGV